MKKIFVLILFAAACQDPLMEGRDVPVDLQEARLKYEQRKLSCLMETENEKQYLKCLGVKP